MLGRTHSQAGIISASLVNYFHPVKSIAECIAVVALGSIASLCCDFDSSNSVPSQLLFGFDDILRKFGILKHRGISHFFFRNIDKFFRQFKFLKKTIYLFFKKPIMWILHFMILGLLILYLINSKDWIISSLVAGYISHPILDDITTFFGIKTGSTFENNFVYNLLGFFAMGGIIFIFYFIF